MKKVVFLGFLITLFSINTSEANDFASALNASIKAYPPTTSIAGMGGIWSALPSPYSTNPAIYPEIRLYNYKYAIYGNYNAIDFNQGPDIKLWSGSGLVTLGPGALRLDYYYFESDRALNRDGLETELEGKSLQIGYGLPITKNISVGATIIPIYSSQTSFSSPLLGGLLVAEGESEIEFSGRLGLLYNPVEKLYVGLVYEYSRSELETKTLNPLTFGYVKSIDHPVTQLIRPGIAVRPWKGGTIGVDWLYGKIDNDVKEDYDINKWFIGAEQWLSPFFALRAGYADRSFTAGLGLHWKNILIDYAYINKSMRDMNPYLGSSFNHMVSLTAVW